MNQTLIRAAALVVLAALTGCAAAKPGPAGPSASQAKIPESGGY